MATDSSTYVFTHRAVLEKAPKVSGVYSIFNSKRWVHVGDSNDIQQSLFRLLNTPSPCLQRFGPLSFSFALVPPAERAAHLEAMIAARNPACVFELDDRRTLDPRPTALRFVDGGGLLRRIFRWPGAGHLRSFDDDRSHQPGRRDQSDLTRR